MPFRGIKHERSLSNWTVATKRVPIAPDKVKAKPKAKAKKTASSSKPKGKTATGKSKAVKKGSTINIHFAL